MPRPRNNEDNALRADFVFQDSNQNVDTKTKIITFSTSVQITPTANDRSFQENKLMENILDSRADLALTKTRSSNNNRGEENILPKSCFRIFARGFINNLKETGKCFGLKR